MRKKSSIRPSYPVLHDTDAALASRALYLCKQLLHVRLLHVFHFADFCSCSGRVFCVQQDRGVLHGLSKAAAVWTGRRTPPPRRWCLFSTAAAFKSSRLQA